MRRLQTDSPMVPFLVDEIEEIAREFCMKFILTDVMEKKLENCGSVEVKCDGQRCSKTRC